LFNRTVCESVTRKIKPAQTPVPASGQESLLVCEDSGFCSPSQQQSEQWSAAALGEYQPAAHTIGEESANSRAAIVMNTTDLRSKGKGDPVCEMSVKV
jgi:hypothetical protein